MCSAFNIYSSEEKSCAFFVNESLMYCVMVRQDEVGNDAKYSLYDEDN
jgi:hypothetical protein